MNEVRGVGRAMFAAVLLICSLNLSAADCQAENAHRIVHVPGVWNGMLGCFTAAELYAAISQLPDDFRDALVAIDVVGLSYAQAARALKVREETITTRLHRARQRVARTLASDRS